MLRVAVDEAVDAELSVTLGELVAEGARSGPREWATAGSTRRLVNAVSPVFNPAALGPQVPQGGRRAALDLPARDELGGLRPRLGGVLRIGRRAVRFGDYPAHHRLAARTGRVLPPVVERRRLRVPVSPTGPTSTSAWNRLACMPSSSWVCGPTGPRSSSRSPTGTASPASPGPRSPDPHRQGDDRHPFGPHERPRGPPSQRVSTPAQR